MHKWYVSLLDAVRVFADVAIIKIPNIEKIQIKSYQIIQIFSTLIITACGSKCTQSVSANESLNLSSLS